MRERRDEGMGRGRETEGDDEAVESDDIAVGMEGVAVEEDDTFDQEGV